jgi:hypothetical protein
MNKQSEKNKSAPSDLADLPNQPQTDSGVTGLDDNDQGSEGGRTFKKLEDDSKS